MIWRWLTTDDARPLIEALTAGDPADPGTLSRQRSRFSVDQVTAAAQLVTARRKARGRITDADALIADAQGVEQASTSAAAAHKAARFADRGIGSVVDLCSGIGIDARALAAIADVVAIDREQRRAFMTGHNAGCPVAAADVRDLVMRDVPFHLDPSRRDESRRHRLWRYEDYQPGPAFIDDLLRRCPDGAIKLGPGVELDVLPAGEVELVSEDGRLVQAVLWTGRLAGDAARRATCLPRGETIVGPTIDLPLADPEAFVHVVDPAIERAGLMGRLAERLGLAGLHPAVNLLTGDAATDSPWLLDFPLMAHMAWREKKVAAWLRSNDAGPVEVRTRGVSVDASGLARRLRGTGETRYTLFLVRLDRKQVALICRT